MKRVLVPLAPGFEEIEAITVIDILRRAGVEVVVAGTEPGPIAASRQTRHLPDCELETVLDDRFDMIVLPGGQPGTTHLGNDPRVRRCVEAIRDHGGFVAAICAAPSVLAGWGLVDDCTVTSHPGVAETVSAAVGRYSEDRVVIDGRTITSRAAGTAMEFAFVLVEQLCGAEQAAAVNQGVLARL